MIRKKNFVITAFMLTALALFSGGICQAKDHASSAGFAPGILKESDSRIPDRPYPKLPYREMVFPRRMISSPHSASIVELPDGQLFAVWYADWYPKSIIWGARRQPGAQGWEGPHIVHRTEGVAVKNPVLYLGRDGKLHLFWTDEKRFFTLVKNTVRMKTSGDFGRTWGNPRNVDGLTWFLVKTRPIRLADGSIILPVYTDISTTSAVAISKDDGLTWEGPKYILPFFGIQPAIIQRSDSTLFALMRCGMPPRLAWQATSSDMGNSWKDWKFSGVKNPGTSIDMIKLRNGHVVLAFNNSKKDLTGVSLAVSYDEGRTWPHVREIESGLDKPNTYPSLLEDRHGLIHVLYTYNGRTDIVHFVADEEWIRSGRGLEGPDLAR